MPRTCSTCTHPKRSEIEAALVAGEPLRNIAKRYGTSAAAVLRHRNACVSRAIVTARGAAEAIGAEAVLARLREVEGDARRITSRAEKEGDLRAALVGLRQLADLIELSVKLVEKAEEARASESDALLQAVALREGIDPDLLRAEAERIAGDIEPHSRVQ